MLIAACWLAVVQRIKKGGALRASIYYFLRDAGGNKMCQSATFRSDRNQGTSNHLISVFYFPLKSAFCLNLKQVTEEGRKVENDFDFKMCCSCIYLFIGFYTQLWKWKNKRQIQNSNSKQKPCTYIYSSKLLHTTSAIRICVYLSFCKHFISFVS